LVEVGVHDFEISKGELNIDAGIVICRVMCGGVVLVRRLIVVGD